MTFDAPYDPEEIESIPEPAWSKPDWDEDRILRLAAALGHPWRIEILLAYEAEPASPTMLAHGQTITNLGNVSYHTTKLLEVKAIHEVGNRGVRGTVEHFYRATPFGRECLNIARVVGCAEVDADTDGDAA